MKKPLIIGIALLLALGAGCFRASEPVPEDVESPDELTGVPYQRIEDFIPTIDEPSVPPEDLALPPEDPSPKPGEIA
ncbi:hypothetical protein GF380_05750, partial [Candidatus Uhrbacteria bacterium]|nr:hypothetical protein [Candidatus Uhrbacteria bacterium]MBD3284505.1 hypothetical protein [Candidatus Uhrbacteria bacterium]